MDENISENTVPEPIKTKKPKRAKAWRKAVLDAVVDPEPDAQSISFCKSIRHTIVDALRYAKCVIDSIVDSQSDPESESLGYAVDLIDPQRLAISEPESDAVTDAIAFPVRYAIILIDPVNVSIGGTGDAGY